MPVHIPRPKIEKLAFQTKGVGIFAKSEYPAVALAVGIFVLERSVALAPTFREPLHTFFTGEY